MSFEFVEIEYIPEHVCKGHVMSCGETGRSIASFWNEHDACKSAFKINGYDKLAAFVSFASKYSEDVQIKQQAIDMLKELAK